MQKYCLLGWPVKHSVSPQMQMAGFNSVGIDANYDLIEVEPALLATKWQELRQSYSGWNITVPHKEAAFNLVDIHDESAILTGCVNTVVNNNGVLTGYSTDGYGMERSVKEAFDFDIAGKSILFIGAGGAARSVALHFGASKASYIYIVNRTIEKAALLSSEISSKTSAKSDISSTTDSAKIMEMAKDCDMIIQSTSLGLKESDALPLPLDFIKPEHLVVDMIYHETPFLKASLNLGCKITDGRGMLLHQGVKAWEYWTGLEGPVSEMRNGLSEALNG